MFKHFVKIFFRNIKRNSKIFLIELLGLSTGLACVFLITLWVLDEFMVDKFHADDDRIYQVMENVQQANGITTSEYSSGPMAESLVQDIPEVAYAATAKKIPNDVTLSTGDKNIKAVGQYVGKDFFNIFSYGLLEGGRDNVLESPNAIVISKSLAEKMFNSVNNAIGKSIAFQHNEKFTVSGVLDDIPSVSTEQFDFLLSYEKFKENNPWVLEWKNSITYTYVLLKDNSNIVGLNTKLAAYVNEKSNGEILHRTPFLKKYSDIYLLGKYENGVQTGGRIAYVRLFSIIAIFILLIACINFINLTTANSSIRIKEIGIKKVMGSERRVLGLQFFIESIGVVFIAFMVAVVLVYLFLPEFNRITGKNLSVELGWTMIAVFLTTSLLTTFLSGIYPALYLSKINPALGIKGISKNPKGEAWFRKGLVIFQFSISTILILGVIVVYKQIEFIQSQNLGYDSDNIIIFNREGEVASEENLATFLSEVRNLPGVANASSIGHDLKGHNMSTYDLDWEGKQIDDKTQFENIAVNEGMMETLGMELKQGRFFSNDFGAEAESIIFNQAAIAHMGLKDPVGKTIRFWGSDMKIIGVVSNFNFESMHEIVKPSLLRFAPSWTNNIMVKLEIGREQQALSGLQDFYAEFNPGFPLDFRFLNENYESQYVSERRVATLSRYFAGLAILISCLGLLGLAIFSTARRRKEIGIRKTLGQSSTSVVVLISSEFVKLVLAAICLGLPIAFFLTKDWLSQFAYRTDLQFRYFIIAGVGAVLVALLTVSIQAVKASNINPVKALREE
jgi:ABC-type antimicrobial peptide transport system permease subunit